LTLVESDITKLTGGQKLSEIVFDTEAIAARVKELGDEITEHYPSGDLLVLGLLLIC